MHDDMSFFQALEQVEMFLVDITPILWAFYQNLIVQGFTEDQAFELTRDVLYKLGGDS